MKKWLYTLIHALVVFAAILCFSLIYTSFRRTADITGHAWPAIIVLPLIFCAFGLLIGLEHLINEISKKGRWTFNLPRILFLGLPALLFGFSVNIYYSAAPVISFFGRLIPTFFAQSPVISQLAQILLGYILITNFSKKAQ